MLIPFYFSFISVYRGIFIVFMPDADASSLLYYQAPKVLSRNDAASFRILLAAHTNVAVDRVLMGLKV